MGLSNAWWERMNRNMNSYRRKKEGTQERSETQGLTQARLSTGSHSHSRLTTGTPLYHYRHVTARMKDERI